MSKPMAVYGKAKKTEDENASKASAAIFDNEEDDDLVFGNSIFRNRPSTPKKSGSETSDNIVSPQLTPRTKLARQLAQLENEDAGFHNDNSDEENGDDEEFMKKFKAKFFPEIKNNANIPPKTVMKSGFMIGEEDIEEHDSIQPPGRQPKNNGKLHDVIDDSEFESKDSNLEAPLKHDEKTTLRDKSGLSAVLSEDSESDSEGELFVTENITNKLASLSQPDPDNSESLIEPENREENVSDTRTEKTKKVCYFTTTTGLI